MYPNDRMIEASEHLRLAKEHVSQAHHEADESSGEIWGETLTGIFLRIASLEEQVEELADEL